jgi:anti-sigma-K factor RskA
MTDRPRFEDLVGDVGDLEPAERARLQRVHDLLLAAGPPPELPPRLAEPPQRPRAQVIPFDRRRWRTAGLAVAAALLLTFGAGWLIGGHRSGLHAQRTVAMSGDHGAHASLVVLRMDEAGNWPMKMTVTGLPTLGRGRTYTLWLTRGGKLESPCGTFAVGKGTTTVRLNAPYRLKEYSGWVVVASGTTKPLLRTATL